MFYIVQTGGLVKLKFVPISIAYTIQFTCQWLIQISFHQSPRIPEASVGPSLMWVQKTGLLTNLQEGL